MTTDRRLPVTQPLRGFLAAQPRGSARTALALASGLLLTGALTVVPSPAHADIASPHPPECSASKEGEECYHHWAIPDSPIGPQDGSGPGHCVATAGGLQCRLLNRTSPALTYVDPGCLSRRAGEECWGYPGDMIPHPALPNRTAFKGVCEARPREKTLACAARETIPAPRPRSIFAVPLDDEPTSPPASATAASAVPPAVSSSLPPSLAMAAPPAASVRGCGCQLPGAPGARSAVLAAAAAMLLGACRRLAPRISRRPGGSDGR